MTQLERADLHAAIETRYPDNTTEDITPLRLRQGLHELVDSVFVTATDTGAVPNVPLYQASTTYVVGFTVRFTPLGGSEGFYAALKAGKLASPQGNFTDWKVVPGPVTPTALSQRLSLVQAQGMENDSAVAGRTYLIDFGPNAQGRPQTIAVRGVSNNAFDVEGTLEVDGVRTAVTQVNVGAGTWQVKDEARLIASELVASRQPYAGLTPRAALLKLLNESSPVPVANQAPSVTINGTASGTVGTQQSFQAIASDSDGTVAKVELCLMANATTLTSFTVLDTDVVSPFVLNWTPTSAGNFPLRMRATDDQGAVSFSSVLAVQVANASLPVPAQQDLHLLFDGNSIVANPTFAQQVVSKLQNALAAVSDPRQVTYTVVAISGQSTQLLHDNAADVDAAYVAGKTNILVAWELFNQFRPPVLPRSVTSSTDLMAAVATGVDLLQDYCAARRAAHPDLLILVGTPPPDKYRGSDPDFNPPRTDFFAAIQVPVRDQLLALLNGGTSHFHALFDVTSDTAYDPADPAVSGDGVHPTSVGYVLPTNRCLYGLLQLLFATPQPAAVQANATYANYLSGSTGGTYTGGGLTNTNGLVTGTGSGYGNLGLDVYKSTSDRVNVLLSRYVPGCYDGIQGYSLSYVLTHYQDMRVGYWFFNNNGYPGLAYIDAAGSTNTLTLAVTADTFAGIWRRGNVLTLELTTDGGLNWQVVYSYLFQTLADLFPVVDVFGPSGTLAYPQWVNLVPVNGQLATNGLLPGYARTPLTSATASLSTSAAHVVSRLAGSNGQGLAKLKLAAGTDGRLACSFDNGAAADAAYGVKGSNVEGPYPTIGLALYRGKGDKVLALIDNGQPRFNICPVNDGDFFELVRVVAQGTYYLTRSVDQGLTWQRVNVAGGINYYNAGDDFVVCHLTQDTAEIHDPQGENLVPA